jgi:hypothetical protein
LFKILKIFQLLENTAFLDIFTEINNTFFTIFKKQFQSVIIDILRCNNILRHNYSPISRVQFSEVVDYPLPDPNYSSTQLDAEKPTPLQDQEREAENYLPKS